jgi:hypothetical protein
VRRSRRIASGGAVEFSSGPPAGPHALLAHPAEDPIVHFLTSTAPARSCPLRRHRGPMPRNRPNSGHSRFATGLQHPTPNIPDMGKKQLAVAMTTMSVAALGGGIGAAGAQAQNDETLSGTATTSGGASGLCLSSSLLATAYSNVAGRATGPYAGNFTETNATASLSRSAGKTQLKLAIPFAISSGTTTITGTISNAKPYAGGSPLCGPSFQIFGIDVTTNGAQYTATIQRPGLPAQTISGTAQINGGFQFRPFGRQTTVTETLLAFPSP